ncbi:MAG TPA: methyltransferase domain-containing protein [Gemmatimonadaceae bacterium]|nr:methyltransferase domain-containing protein [Gemmatimonadaceae bacterium]
MTTHTAAAPVTKGRVLRSHAWAYDALVWFLTFGRERAFRERLLDLARLAPGESVLDIGCGTGTLAIAAKGRVGDAGIVRGIDASPEMIARARKKAAKAGVDVVFETAVAESLPFPERKFDVVLSTLMLHHLPRAVRAECAREVRRVLKPGGRILAVDFGRSGNERRGLIGHLHRHGHFTQERVAELLRDAGFTVAESGPVGRRDLHFTMGVVPGG